MFQDNPISSQLKVSSGLKFFNVCQRFSRIVSRSLRGALVALPCILYCLKLCHFLKLSTHLSEHLNLSSFSKKAKLKVLVERILSVMMRPAWRAVSIQIVKASSILGKETFFLHFKPA